MTRSTELPAARVGETLRAARRARGLSIRAAARSVDVSVRRLRALERGEVRAPDGVVAALAEAYGCSFADLVPDRDPSAGVDGGVLPPGAFDTLTVADDPDGVLRRYLGALYELRDASPGSDLHLRTRDLDELAAALGGTPDAIETRLVELIGVTRDQAAAMRATILRRRFLVPTAGLVLGVGLLQGGIDIGKTDGPKLGTTPTAVEQAHRGDSRAGGDDLASVVDIGRGVTAHRDDTASSTTTTVPSPNLRVVPDGATAADPPPPEGVDLGEAIQVVRAPLPDPDLPPAS